MRLTSRSNSSRSKNRLRDHGRNPLSRVARISFSSPAVTAFAPTNLIDDTCTSPVSRHDAAASAMSRIVANSLGITSRGVARLLLSLALGLPRTCPLGGGLGSSRGFLTLGKALAQAFHEIDHLPFGRRFRGGQRRLASFDARLNQLHDIVAVLVGVFRRVPCGREILDEHLRHIELGLAHFLS